MDYSKFLNDEFDHKQWINEAFKMADPNQSSDQYASNLVMKLQVYMQEVNTMIEDNCQQAVQSIPRVLREMESIRQEASLLQDQMTAVQGEIEKVEQETSSTMHTLVLIDKTKNRLTSVGKALKDADSWTSLSQDLEEVMKSRDIDKICEKIVGLQMSLSMLTSVSDYQTRVRRVDDLKNTLESLISPRIIQSCSTMNAQDCAYYVGIMDKIGRLDQAKRYYQSWLDSHIAEQWKKIVDSDNWNNGPDVFYQFYQALLKIWLREIVTEYFPSMMSVVAVGMAQSIDASQGDRMVEFIQMSCQDADGPLDRIELFINYFKKTADFTDLLEDSIAKQNLDFLKEPSCAKLAAAIYSIHRGISGVFKVEAASYLDEKLINTSLDSHDVTDTIELLEQSVDKVYGLTDEIFEKAMKISHGTALIDYLEAVKKYLGDYIREILRILSNIREKSLHTNKHYMNQLDDFHFLPTGLRLAMVTGGICLKTESFIQNLMQKTTEHVALMNQKRNQYGFQSIFHDYSSLLLDEKSVQESLTATLAAIKGGETPGILSSIRQLVNQACEKCNDMVYDVTLTPISHLLDSLVNLEVWSGTSGSGEVLPDFAYSPHEDITKMGQFFLTLPQQLEPYLSNDSPSLTECIRLSRHLARISGGEGDLVSSTTQGEAGAEVWLEYLAIGAMNKLVQMALKIKELSPHGAKQLKADLEYFTSVMEDLELTPLSSLLNLKDLISIPQSEFQEAADGKPKQLVNSVKNMRNF